MAIIVVPFHVATEGELCVIVEPTHTVHFGRPNETDFATCAMGSQGRAAAGLETRAELCEGPRAEAAVGTVANSAVASASFQALLCKVTLFLTDSTG